MKLQALASKPQLTKVEIDDESIVAKYGEAIEFYIYDRQNMDTFMKLATLGEDSPFNEIADMISGLILDEEGNTIMTEENILPVDVMLKVVEKTVAMLGNSVTQTLEK